MRLYPPFVDIRPISTTTARKLFFPIVLGLLVLLGYLPALHTAFLADDFILLSQAQIKYSGLSIFAVSPYWWFYRPLSALVWQYTFKLFGYHPLGYHLFSLGLHWASSLLIVALVRRFTTHSTLLAPGAGLLFALLPLHPETVVWLASQFDLLATVCYLATLCCLLLAWERRSIPFYLLALGAYQLSLWSKESAFTLPIIVVMFGLALRDRPRPRILIGGTLPFALLLGINLLQRYLVWGRIGGYLNAPSDYPSFIWDHLAGTLAVLVGPLNRLLLPAYLRQLWMLGMAALLVAGLMAGYNQRLILLGAAGDQYSAGSPRPRRQPLPVPAGGGLLHGAGGIDRRCRQAFRRTRAAAGKRRRDHDAGRALFRRFAHTHATMADRRAGSDRHTPGSPPADTVLRARQQAPDAWLTRQIQRRIRPSKWARLGISRTLWLSPRGRAGRAVRATGVWPQR